MMDYYKVLGVPTSASQDEIKAAYRRLAKEHHPDSNPDNVEEATERFKRINEAYEHVGDERRRAAYDARRSGAVGFADFGSAGFPSGFPGFRDPFSFFRNRAPARGSDIRGTIEVTLEEAARGASKPVSFTRSAKCGACGGKGAADGGAATCPGCSGVGVVATEYNSGPFRVASHTQCPMCDGKGVVALRPCQECSGRGLTERLEKIEVKIPQAASSNDVLRVPEMGNFAGSGAGDLLVVVRLRTHPTFERISKLDLAARLSVPLKAAILGGPASFEGLLGQKLEVDVPRGCQHGHVVVIRGAGMPGGDLHVRVEPKIPVLPDDLAEKVGHLLP